MSFDGFKEPPRPLAIAIARMSNSALAKFRESVEQHVASTLVVDPVVESRYHQYDKPECIEFIHRSGRRHKIPMMPTLTFNGGPIKDWPSY